MKDFNELKKLIIAEYNNRNLKSDVRYKALDDFHNYLIHKHPDLFKDISLFPKDKKSILNDYQQDLSIRGKKLSQGAKSMINEVYNQIAIVMSL